MRFYNQPHAYYCSVDLHARSMFTHVLDQAGATVFARDLRTPFRSFWFLHGGLARMTCRHDDASNPGFVVSGRTPLTSGPLT